MASITKQPNGNWRARFYDSTGKQQGRVFPRKAEAQQWVNEQNAAIITGQYVDPRSGRVTVAEMATKWLASHPGWAESTKERNRSIVERHILPRWGGMAVSKVSFEDAQEWVASLVKTGLAGGSVRKIAGVLSSILGLAVKSKRLAVNPVEGVDLPKQALTRRRYLSVEQVDALADASGDHRDVVLILSYTGLRIGELAALRARNVQMLRRRLKVEEAVTEVNGRLVWATPKDHQRRSVAFPEFLSEPLAARLQDKQEEDPVFGSVRGDVLRVRNMRRDWFNDAATKAGVPGLTPHELRHTAASIAVSAGASVLVLQRMLGHEKPSVTLDVYSDLFDADLDDVAERMSEARANSRKTKIRHGDVVKFPLDRLDAH